MALFGKKSDHPMADLRSAQELLAEIPKNDAFKALQEVTVWVESMRSDHDIRLNDRFAVLRLLDETARPHETKVTREYFSATAPSSFHENRLWTALNDFFTNMAEAYHEVLVGCRDGEKGASSLKDSRMLIALRGIHATMGRLKCAAVRYTPVEATVWEQLAEYYAHAETSRYLDQEFQFHGGHAADNSVRRRLAGVLLWWGTGTGSLKPIQIHLSERLTSHLSPHLDMGIEPAADSLFCFDLAQPQPPTRFGGDATEHPNLRFIRLGKVQARLESLIASLEKGVVPGEINLGGTYAAEPVLEAAKRLAANWLSAPPTRRTVRRSIHVPISVVRGYAGLIDQVHQNNGLGEEEAGEIWDADDISASGFRCTLPAARGGSVRVGTLIGFKPENVKHWGAGIVRRLRRDGQNNLDVGVEVLANRAPGVMLREQGGSDDRPAVWLVKPGTDNGEVRVLTKPGNFDDSSTLQTRADGKHYLLIPQKLDEKGDDYDLMRYRKVEQEASSEAA
jgi:hypothetical protein